MTAKKRAKKTSKAQKSRSRISEQQVEEMLNLAFATYEGLTEEQIQEIEKARFDQKHFFKGSK